MKISYFNSPTFTSTNFMRTYFTRLLAGLFLILGTMGANAQNVNVNPGGGTYPTLQSAFAAINAGTHTGSITVDIVNNTTETGTAVLNASGTGAASYTLIVISPSGGASRTITGSIAGPLINLNGADNVTIDGLNAGGNSLTISNTSTGSASTIQFIGDASTNIIQNCTIQGSASTASFGTILFSTGTTTGNDDNNINNNNITAAGANLPINAIFSQGTSAAIDNSNNTINANNISDYFSATLVSIGINLAATGNSGWTITTNRLFQTATRLYTTGNTHSGIFVGVGAGYNISGNIIGFANSGGTGTTNIVGNSVALTGTFPSAYTSTGTANTTRYIAINCAFTAGGAVSSLQNNTIGGFALYTSSGAATTNGIWCGINITSGNANIGTTAGNTIGATSGTGSIYTACTNTGGAAVGIYATSTNTVSIQNNSIGAIDAVATTATITGGFNGIDVAGTGGVFTISNNTIGNTTADNIRTGYTLSGANLSNAGVLTSTTGTGSSVFIRNASSGATLNITGNTFRGFATSSTGQAVTGITNTGSVTTTINLNNNFLGTAGLGWVRYAFACSGTLSGILNSAGASTAALSIQTNDFRGITHTTAGSSTHTYINNTATSPATFTISNNTFTNLNVNTTGGVTFLGHSGTLASTSVSNINGNSIVTAYNKTGAGGTIVIRTSGSSTPAGAVVNFQNNNFSNMTFTGAITFTGYFDNDGGAPSKSITGNIFNNNNFGTGTVTQILAAAFNGNNTTISNNTITNQTTQGSITCIIMGGSGTSTTNTVSGNTITGISSTGTGGAVTAISSSSAATTTNINGNTINNLSSTSTTATVVGITSSTTANIFSNTINTLSNVGSTSGVTNGIMITGGTTVNVYKNKIYDLLTTGAFTTTPGVNGIVMSAGTTVSVYNNLIGDLRATTASSTDAVRGISVTSTTATTTYNVYYNSVNIAASSSGVNFGTSGIFHAASATATTATLNLRNNIIVNSSTAAGTGVVTCFRRSAAATLGNYGAASNNNDFFSATGGSVMHDGTTAFNITTFKAAVAPRDAGSFSEDPEFQSTVGASADFLKYKVSSPKQIESGAVNIGGITDDYFGTVRQGNFGYAGTGTAPDVGAWELQGIGLDLVGPSISYTLLPNTACTTAPTLSATITDASLVNTTPGTKPRLYYKRTTTANAFVGNTSGDNGWKFVEATNASSPFSFTFDYSIMFGGAPTGGDVIQYFVVAQDLAGTPNVSINSGTFVPSTPASVDLQASGVTSIGGSINSYSLLPVIATSVTIGAAGTYPTLTGPGGLFAAINAGGLSGNTTALIVDASLAETGTNALNQIAYGCAGPYTLTIKPDAGVTTVLSGSVAGPLINLNGADNVIFDGSNNGSSSKNMTISNTSTGGSTIQLINDATSNTVKNIILLGVNSSSSSGTVVFSTTTGTLGNSTNTIDNCDIRDGATVPVNAVYSLGTAGFPNAGNTISNNNIFNWTGSGILVSSGGAGNSWIVNNNNVYQTAARSSVLTAISLAGGNTHTVTNNKLYQTTGVLTAAYTGISISGATNGHTVSSNSIGGATATRSGTALEVNAASSNLTAISLSVGTTTATNVNSNTISNIATTNAGTSSSTYGISISGGNVNIGTGGGNTFGGGAAVYDTIRNNYDNGIIYNTGGGVLDIQNNTIGNVSYYRAGGDRTAGIYISAGTATIRNNIVRDISSNSTSTGFSFLPVGIYMTTATSGHLIEGNQIYNIRNTNAGASAYTAVGLYVGSITASSVSKNRIYNILADGTGTGASSPQVFGIYASSGSVTYSNNMIAVGSTVGLETRVNGIQDLGSGTNNYYFNSVSVTGTTAAGTNNSYAFNRSGTTTVDIRNNIFSNTRTGGTGFHVAIANTNAAATGWAATASNYNDLYSATGSNLAQWLGSAVGNNRDFTGWKASQGAGTPGSGGDANSFNVLPAFVSSTDLHIPAATSGPLESGGIAAGGITTDIDNDTRPGPAGSVNGGATAPDMGADEFDGIPAANMTYVSSTTTQNNVTNVSTNTTNQEVIGIQIVTSGTLNPLSATSFTIATTGTTNLADITNARLWYTGTSSTFATTTQFGSTVAVPGASFPIAGTQVLAQGINYFWLTYDVPCGATATNVIDAECNSVTVVSPQTPTVQAPAGSRTIVPGPMSGTYTVGGGGSPNYATLTAAIADVNTKGLGGNTTLSIMGNLTEAGAMTINQWAECGGSGFTLTIKPGAGSPVISASAATAVIILNGADRVIIDGSLGSTVNTTCPPVSASRDMTITNTNTGTSSAVIWLQTTAGANPATNNIVRNCNITGNASTTTLIGVGSGSATIGTSSLGTGNDNNSYINNNIRAVQIGIYSQGASAASKNNNTTINQNVMNAVRGSTPSLNIGIAGILVGFENFITIGGNVIGSAGGSSADGFGIAAGGIGISTSGFTGNEVLNATISYNRIDSIRGASTFSSAGIFVATSTNAGTNLIANNSISNTGTNGTSGDFGVGILVGGGPVTTNVYFNSVSMSGTFTGGSQPNFALAIGGTDPIVNIRNNVLSSRAVNGGGTALGVGAYAIGYAYGTFANLTVNNNDYYTTGTEAKFAKTGSLASGSGTDVATLLALQTATSQDAASISTDPLFNSLSNLQPQLGSPLVGAGVNIPAVFNDILCAGRANPPTIGAYETAVDATAPVITYTALTTSCSTGDRALNGVTITDASGVPTAGALQPRIYFRKNAGTWFSSQGALQSGSGTNGTWNFTIVAASMGGLVAGDVIQYYVIAQDIAAPSNIGSNPSAGLVATDVNTVTTAPTTPNSTTVGTTLNGTYTVGSGGSYPTLTAAVAAYNSGCLGGPVIFELLDATYSGSETFPIAINLNADASVTNTLTIRPATGVTAAITGSSTSIITFNGARFVTIDGRIGSTGSTHSLTITNTAASTSPAITLINDATSDAVRYTDLKSDNSTTTSGVVFFSTTTGANGNDNNTIDNCNIGPNVANPTNGIYSSGTTTLAAQNNSGNTISNNNIFDFYNSTSTSTGGVGVNISSGSTDWTINANSFYQTATRTTFGNAATFNGILLSNSSGNNFIVTNNFIGGSAPGCGGSPLTINTSATLVFRAFQASVGATTPTSLQGNTIRNINITTASTSTANSLISAVTGSFNIGNTTGNTLGSPTGTGSVSFTQTTTSTTTVFSGILVGTGTPGDINVSNNTVGSITVANSSTGAVNLRGISINGAVTSSTVNNNVVGSATTANSLNVNNLTPASTSNVIGIEVASGITVANSISGNTVANILHNSTSTAALCRGITYAGTGLSTISNNIVHDLSSASTNTTVSGGATAVQGILYTGTSTAGATISLNEVYAIIASNNGAVQTNPTGIGYSNPNAGVITRNRIYDIRNASTMAVATTPPTAIGLLVRAAPSGGVTISNNMISLGNGQTTNTEFIGIINSFTNSGNSIFFNTVNIEGAAAAGALPSFCFLRGDNSAASAVTSPVDIRNNIFNNARTGGTGIHYAIGNNYGNAASSATGWAAGASNYNLLNGSGGVGYWNTTTNFAGWKAASSSDANSISGETVTFVNSALGNLHLNMGVTPTKLESGGIAGTGVTVDFDNDTRPGPAGSVNGGATAPDMGADEFDGVPLDLTAPVITYTNLINTTCTTNRAFTATISDNSGINVTAGTKPRVYYKRSTDGNVWNDNTNGTDGWKYAEASNASSPFTFTIDYSLLNGGTGVTGGNTVQYFVVAQDLAGTPNVAINSGTFALQPSSVALTGAAFPIGGTINSYNINASGLNTTLTVGALGDYTSLTGAAGLFNAINSNGLVGNTTVNILDASVTETGAVALNQINSGGCSVASYSLVIKPNSGVTATLTGTLNSNALVRILSSNVTIDGSNSGGTTRDLTITNTAVTSPSVILVGSTGTTPVTSTTIKNSILINGAQTATAVVLSDGTTLGNAGYFNNITVQNNNIQQAFIGVYAIGVPATGNGSGTLITGNDLNTAGANSIRLVGIYAQGVDGATVSNNNIANMANANAESPRAIWLATGTNSATVSGNNLSTLASSNTGAFAITGIYVTPGATATAITVNNNTINGLTNAGTGTTFAGILVTSPNTNITNNTVTGLTQNGAATAYGITASGVTTATISGNTVNTMLSTTSGTATGINIQGLSTGVNVFRNTISNIKNNNTGGWGANGIQLSSTSTTANTKVYNNVIYDVAAYGYDLGASVTDNGYGIIATSGAGYSIDFNSVHMNTDQSASGLPAAFNVTSGVTLAGAINLRSNIFATTQTATSGTGRYAIYSGAAATVFGTINYNDYYSTSGFVGFLGSSQATIANWRTASTQDLNSVAVDPLFTTPTNLVVTAASPVIGAGVTVSGVTTDYLGSTRNGLPSMGAYEQRVVFSAKVYLQGAYSAGLLQHRANTAQWTTATNAGALSQPYSAAPFSYTGTETVAAGFFANTAGNDPMDWVLLELRDATTPTTVISRRAAIIKEDGMIVDLDGTSPVSFRGITAGNYFVVVRHRNHLGVRSGTTQLVDGNAAVPTPYDFTTAQSQALQDGAITTNAAMAQNGSAFMLWAGNVNQDVYVRATTRTIPLPVLPSDAAAILVILGGDPNATGGYTPGDVNLDGYTRATTRSIPLPVLPSDAAIILSTPLSGVPTATRQEHKVNN